MRHSFSATLTLLLAFRLFAQLPEYSPHHIGETLQDWTIVNHAPVVSNTDGPNGVKVIVTLDKHESATWTFADGKLTSAQLLPVEHHHSLRNALIVIGVAVVAGGIIGYKVMHRKPTPADNNCGVSCGE